MFYGQKNPCLASKKNISKNYIKQRFLEFQKHVVNKFSIGVSYALTLGILFLFLFCPADWLRNTGGRIFCYLVLRLFNTSVIEAMLTAL